MMTSFQNCLLEKQLQLYGWECPLFDYSTKKLNFPFARGTAGNFSLEADFAWYIEWAMALALG